MKIINLERGEGKTTRLCYASESQNIPILCAYKAQKEEIVQRAAQHGLKIPYPICVDDIICNKQIWKEVLKGNILIDEAPMVLNLLLTNLGFKGSINAITLTEKDNLI